MNFIWMYGECIDECEQGWLESFAGNGELAVTEEVFVTTSTSTTFSMSRLYLW
jgi:hypothetical protein